MELKNKTVMVTGGEGFLGGPLVSLLAKEGAKVFVVKIQDYDLRNESSVAKLFKDANPQIVVHAAVHGGGIGYMAKHPGSIYYDNVLMNSFMVEYSKRAKVEKFLGIGTVCSYPKFTPVPFKEENLWDGYPEETNAPYGLTKKMMLVHTQAYEQEYGFKANNLLLVNMYGPRDNFNPDSSHVIPALIMRFDRAKKENQPEVVCWGTGKPTREFLFVEDAAEAIVLALKNCNTSAPINVGSGEEVSIKDLSELIASIIGYKGKIVWDKSKPDGQPKRRLDVSKAKKEFGFKAKTSFKDGFKKTITWYQNNLAGK
jgi:GDP-L-fucose synthase